MFIVLQEAGGFGGACYNEVVAAADRRAQSWTSWEVSDGLKATALGFLRGGWKVIRTDHFRRKI